MIHGRDDDIEIFTFGGPLIFARAWARDHDAEVSTAFMHMYDDRNIARRTAEDAGGVAW